MQVEKVSLVSAERVLKRAVLIFCLLAIIANLFHDLAGNPQTDNQGLWESRELSIALRKGTVSDFLLDTRKYPLFYLLLNLPIYEGLDLIYDDIPRKVYFFFGRSVTLLYALGTFALLFLICRKLFQESYLGMLLLGSSLLYVMFSTAIRPHIIVGFWSMLSYYCFLLHAESHSRKHLLCSYLSAVAAFCTLQSGLLAFIFPVFASLSRDRTLRGLAQIAVSLLMCGLLSALIGYTFLLAPLFGGPLNTGIDLGHNIGLSYQWNSGVTVIRQLIGNSPFILLFGLVGIGLFALKPRERKMELLPVALYSVIYCCLFLFHSIAAGRFLIPLLPFLVLFGVQPLKKCGPLVRSCLFVILIVVLGRFTYLALHHNTFQQVKAVVQERGGKALIAQYPYYYFNLGKDEVVASQNGYSEISTVVLTLEEVMDETNGWTRCHTYNDGVSSSEILLLWNDTEWAYFYALTAKSLGPYFELYCKD